MTGKDIVAAAFNMRGYKYWYGAKREKATAALAGSLKSQYPGVWTEDYYQKALKDCDGRTMVADCSALVCGAYGIKDKGSYQLVYSMSEWTGVPRAGMVGWKKGHVGIFRSDGWDSQILEMRGIDYDFQAVRSYKTCGFTKVLYDPSIDYGQGGYKSIGWHKDDGGWWYRSVFGVGDGTYYKSCCKIIDGHAYIFDADGYIVTLSGVRVPSSSKTGWVET